MSLERFKCVQLSDVIATTSRLDHNPLGPPMLIRSKSNIAETDELMMIRALLRRQRAGCKATQSGCTEPAHAAACENGWLAAPATQMPKSSLARRIAASSSCNMS